MNDHLRSEYEALRHGAGVIDLSAAGKLQVSGKNAVQFLNGLVSNDVKALPAGAGVLAAFPNLQGKLVALCRIYNLGPHLWLELDPSNREKVLKNLSRFVPAGEFFLTDVTDQYNLISVQGPRAAELIAAVTGEPVDPAEYAISERRITEITVRVAAHRRCGETGVDLFVEAEAAPRVREAMLARGAEFGAVLVGQEAFEIARIEAGVPREGIDAGEDYIILESELNQAVSYTKGCYLGQEVIARIHWRGQPAKRLRGLILDAGEAPSPGTPVYAADGKKVGETTSSTRSFALDRNIALAYVHRYYLTPGTEFILKQGEEEVGRAHLVELPFIK
ncbi:MAG TPA: aminomethyltransferase family protein [Blastocatellia bacterium]|nr:aminomethyltransferase family protein [Blastocatellia bacterium]